MNECVIYCVGLVVRCLERLLGFRVEIQFMGSGVEIS
jgi:hypothetical protein